MYRLILVSSSLLLGACQSGSDNLGSFSSLLTPDPVRPQAEATAAIAPGEPVGAISQIEPGVEPGRPDSHAGHQHGSPAERPGAAVTVSRTIDVKMGETEYGDMYFEPTNIAVTPGETIRFRVANVGVYDHEFVLGDLQELMNHKAMMQKNAQMKHDEPNSVQLSPGKTGEVIWTFNNTGDIDFACLIEDHYDLGMYGAVRVAAI